MTSQKRLSHQRPSQPLVKHIRPPRSHLTAPYSLPPQKPLMQTVSPLAHSKLNHTVQGTTSTVSHSSMDQPPTENEQRPRNNTQDGTQDCHNSDFQSNTNSVLSSNMNFAKIHGAIEVSSESLRVEDSHLEIRAIQHETEDCCHKSKTGTSPFSSDTKNEQDQFFNSLLPDANLLSGDTAEDSTTDDRQQYNNECDFIDCSINYDSPSAILNDQIDGISMTEETLANQYASQLDSIHPSPALGDALLHHVLPELGRLFQVDDWAEVFELASAMLRGEMFRSSQAKETNNLGTSLFDKYPRHMLLNEERNCKWEGEKEQGIPNESIAIQEPHSINTSFIGFNKTKRCNENNDYSDHWNIIEPQQIELPPFIEDNLIEENNNQNGQQLQSDELKSEIISNNQKNIDDNEISYYQAHSNELVDQVVFDNSDSNRLVLESKSQRNKDKLDFIGYMIKDQHPFHQKESIELSSHNYSKQTKIDNQFSGSEYMGESTLGINQIIDEEIDISMDNNDEFDEIEFFDLCRGGIIVDSTLKCNQIHQEFQRTIPVVENYNSIDEQQGFPVPLNISKFQSCCDASLYDCPNDYNFNNLIFSNISDPTLVWPSTNESHLKFDTHQKLHHNESNNNQRIINSSITPEYHLFHNNVNGSNIIN